MLMLDIAVVNTALSQIAEDLDTGLSGLQWVVDAYTLALAAPCSRPAPSPTASAAPRSSSPAWASSRSPPVVVGRATSRPEHRPRRAGHRRRDHVRRLARAAGARLPRPKERAGALAVYGATIGASFAVGPLVGGALTSGLDWRWVFHINVPIGIAAT